METLVTRGILLAVLCAVAAAPAYARTPEPLVGEMMLSGRTLVDPPPDERIDRALFFLAGDTARRLYEAMAAPARRNGCDSGVRTKTAGSLTCSREGDRYECAFGILLQTGKPVAAQVC